MSLPTPEKSVRPKQSALQHIETLRADVRDEMKLRIKQRDTYSIQMTVVLGTIVGIATTATATHLQEGGTTSIVSFAYRVLIAAPLIGIYFTTLVLYSYRIHRILAKYLREVIEPQIARLSGTDPACEWENWYCQNAVPGIRKSFFMVSLWVIVIVSPLYIGFTENWQGVFMLPLAIISALYLLATLWVTIQFWRG